MRHVLATAGHVDHGKSTLVQALTGRDPDRLVAEKERGLTIELGFAWTRLPSGVEVAFVDVPGHQRFVGATLAGLGPVPAVVFVVAADQGWQAQSSEHLAAVRALGITDGLLVVTRSDLAEPYRRHEVRAGAARRLAAVGLDVPSQVVSARTGVGMKELRQALDALVARMPAPDARAPVRLWCDRSFTVQGSGTVVTGTLGTGTLCTGDRLSLLSGGHEREVVVRGLHSADVRHDTVLPVSRVAVNLRRTQIDQAGRESVLTTPGAFALARVIDVGIEPVTLADEEIRLGAGEPPEQLMLHVGTTDVPARARPLSKGFARVTLPGQLPWHVGDRAILRDPGTRRMWAARVVDVDPLPLRRRGAARRRADALAAAHAYALAGARTDVFMRGRLADVRLRSRSAEHPAVLRRLGLNHPTAGVRVGEWWVDPEVLDTWVDGVARQVRAHQAAHPLSAGMPIAVVAHGLGLPYHLRAPNERGAPPPLEADLVRHVAAAAGLKVAEGRVRAPQPDGLGPAEAGVASVEARLRASPFASPEREDLVKLGLGPTELAAAVRLGRLIRLPGEIMLLPDAPVRAMRELAALDQPFTLSAARRALGTTRRVAVPLFEHLDRRGWTRRVDDRLRRVVR